jgi:predicted site-specific integrase-resolvase
MQENRLLSPKEIMQRYGISRTTLRKWIKTMGLPVIVISDKKKYVLELDLKEWEDTYRFKKNREKFS